MLCPKCKKMIPDGSRFCLECGSAVSSDSQAEAAQAAARADLSLGAGPTLTGAAAASAGIDASLGDQNTLQGAGGATGTRPFAGSGVSLTERYELEVEIGRGGFAVVWKARDRRLGRTVAVKRLLSEATQGPGAVQTAQRFEREAQAIATLNHRNIVQVFDSDADADGRYIVMEYVSGGTLRDYLKQRGRLPVAEAVALAMGLCRGLAAAHRQGLVHRDVKPANVLLDLGDPAGPVPRLVDFGLARQGRESDVSLTGYGLGTPYYMAPEQRRDAKSVTHTADIYALGKTLYEMVTGELPDSVDPALVPPPEELGRIILKCIRSNPAERYFSAEDLLRDLEALGTGGVAVAPGVLATGGSQCPSCGRRNPADAKFCEACGTGLMRRCPECDRENALGLRFCGGCGTDVPGFLQARDAVARMQSLAKELRWSRVTKEHGLLPKEARLPGDQGRKLLADLREVAQAAVLAEQSLAEKRALLAKALTAHEFVEALGLCREILELDPSDTQVTARAVELKATAPRAALLKHCAGMRRMAGAKQFIGARQAANEILEQATVLTQWTAPDPLLCPEGQTGAALRSQAENVLAAADQAVTAASAAVQAGRAAMAEQDYRTAMAKADEAQALCADLPAAAELRQRVEAGLDNLRLLVSDARARVGAVRELTQAGRLAEARTALASVVAQYGEVEVPEDAEVASDWIAAATDLAAAEENLTEQERAAQQRQAALRRRLLRLAAAVAAMTAVALFVWLGVSVSRHRRFAAAMTEAERLLKTERWKEAEAAYGRAAQVEGFVESAPAKAGTAAAKLGAAVAAAEAAKGIEAARSATALQMRKQQYDASVAVAQRAAAASDWTTAEQEVAKALALDSMGSDALALAAKLEPTLTITAELDGHEVAGAQIAIDGAVQQQTTPASYKLERGKTYAFSVSLLPKDGRFYTTAEIRVTADWHGPRTWTARSEVVPSPTAGQGWTVPELGMELVYVAPGSFQMGSNEYADKVHAVRISRGYWLGTYEVTQAEYEAVDGTNPSKFKGARNPVEQVSWNEASAFCAILTARERAAGRLPAGYEYRLPTEAEWEYAARGGANSDGYTYSGSNDLDEVAWYEINSGRTTHPVGQKRANRLGLYDMTGNVLEWCLDYFDLNAQAAKGRVQRGGCWLFGTYGMSSSHRSNGHPDNRNALNGFRACLAPTIATE